MKRPLFILLTLFLTACVPATPSTKTTPSPPDLHTSTSTFTRTPPPALTLTPSEPPHFPTLTPLVNEIPDPRLASLFDLILHPTWNTLWLDAQSVETITDGIAYYAFIQAWLDQNAGGRVIHSGYLEETPASLQSFQPRFIWLSDGGVPDIFDSGVKTPESGNIRWFVHPLDTAGELLNSLVFAYTYLSSGIHPQAIVGQETFAGRPAFILDWSEDADFTRLIWVDIKLLVTTSDA